MNKFGSAVRRHEEKKNLHPDCSEDCPRHYRLTDDGGEDGTPGENNKEDEEVIRTLFVLRANHRAPESAEDAQEILEIYPLSYENIRNPHTGSTTIYPNDSERVKKEKKERKGFRQLKQLSALCSFDDKDEKVLYIEEWVRQRNRI